MSMIKVENLNFAYPDSYDNVFENVSFQIDTDWKLGFIGRNGRGKTTFLKLLSGNFEYSGKIYTSVNFDYFPYSVEDKKRMTYEILNEVCPRADDWEIIREISYLGVGAEILYRPFNLLSNGEQTKVLLASLFLNEGNFLLIDEPTNHLDNIARDIVADYLNKKKGFILVSHDRNFLDRCVDHILAINKNNIEVQNGNYSNWKENFDKQQQFEFSKNEQLYKDISRLQEASKRSAIWSDKVEKSKKGTKNSGLKLDKGFVGHKSAKMMKRSKGLEARCRQEIEEKSKLLKNVEWNESLKIQPLKHYSRNLLEFNDISIFYDKRTICKNISFNIQQGERVALEGGNGSGKSSLLKLMLGTEISHTGNIHIASGLIISYVQQDTTDLHGSLSDYAKSYDIDETLFKAVLRKMDFERIQFEKDIADYSGGQKKKILIARSLCERAHLYVWDEPLNFIDIYSRIQIEELIKKFEPTMIFVEHDRTFQQKIATKKIVL